MGKSTIRKELLARGYKVYGTDEDGIAAWHNKKTGTKVARPTHAERENGFLQTHVWLIDKKLVDELVLQSKTALIFLCGVASNDYDIHHVFDKRICLTLDEQTLTNRLASRTNSHFGKTPDELNNVLTWRQIIEDKNRSLGALLIDASQPVEVTVDQILSYAD